MSDLVCAAGRGADYGGRWTLPCLNQPARHVLAFSKEIGGIQATGTPVLRFCDEHIEQLVFGGLVDEALIDPEDWARRVIDPEEPNP